MLLLKDLKKSFRQPDGTPLPVLDIAEFRVAAGEQMVLVGRSGCGKTTLLHVIAGISPPGSGKGAAAVGARGAEPSHDPPAGAALGGRTAAGGRGPGAGQQTATAAG